MSFSHLNNIFPPRDDRPPYNRPRQPSLPDQRFGNFNNRYPSDRPPMQQPIQPYNMESEFSDEEESNYMDDPDTLPSQTSTGHSLPYPRPGGFNDRPAKPGFDRLNQTDRFTPPPPDPRTRPQGPNYTKWNPAGKAPPKSDQQQDDYLTFVNRQPPSFPGNPPIRDSGRQPMKLPSETPDNDGQDEYLTFVNQEPIPNHSPFGAPSTFRLPGRPQHPPPSMLPRESLHSPPAPGVPPRSPVRHPQLPDQIPDRPPPRPPQSISMLQRSPQSVPILPPAPSPSYPISRNNSDKASPHISPRPSMKDDEDMTQRKSRINNRSFDSPTRISPSSSRKEENNVISHLMTRQANKSTDSSSSTSSEELTHRPTVAGTFVPTKGASNLTNFSKIHERPISTIQMPPLPSYSESDKDNVIYDLGKALKQKFPNPIEQSESQSIPANRNPVQQLKGYPNESNKPGIKPKPVQKQSAAPALPPRQLTLSESINQGPELPARQEDPYESMSNEIYDDPGSADDVEGKQWYKETMSRGEAESYIERNKEAGRFVVRKRPNSFTEPYALTLWANGKYYNFVIRKRDDGEYALGSKKEGERSFASVVKLIDHHQKTPVVLAEGVGSIKLII